MSATPKKLTVMKGKSEPGGREPDSPWVKVSYALELELPPNCGIDQLESFRVQAEQILDSWLSESAKNSLAAAGVPQIDQAELDKLPWKTKTKEPAKPAEFAWLFGPKSYPGTEQGADKLVQALEKAEGKKLQIGDMLYSFSKDAAFIQRAPVKKEKER